MRVRLVEYHSLLPLPLSPDSVVVDIGASLGHFSRKMTDIFAVDPILVEAHPGLAGDLCGKGFRHVHNLAISDRTGTVAFQLAKRSDAGRIVSGGKATGGQDVVEIPSMDLETFAAREGLSGIDLLKMDIEGAEIAALAACSDRFLKSIRQITIEFHDFCGLTPPAAVEGCLKRLESLGFERFRMSRVGHQDCLLVQRDAVPMSTLQVAWIRHGYRNLKGADRMLRKTLFGRNWAKGYC